MRFRQVHQVKMQNIKVFDIRPQKADSNSIIITYKIDVQIVYNEIPALEFVQELKTTHFNHLFTYLIEIYQMIGSM